MNERTVLKNRLPDVAEFQTAFEASLRQLGFSDDLIYDLTLVCEEVLVNIIRHGYGEPHDGQREIRIHTLVDGQRKVRLEIRDDAVGFDPLSAPERDYYDDRIGGWGLPMLKTLTDRIEYERVGSENVLSIERAERDS